MFRLVLPLAVALVAGALAGTPAAANDIDTCQNGSGDPAVAACTRLIASNKFNSVKLALIYNIRGVKYDSIGDNDHAIADYSESIRLNPKFPVAFRNRGIAYGSKGDRDRAIADYGEAIRLDPKDALALNNRGNAYTAKGDRDRAIADFSEAIRLDPKSAMALYNRAIVYNAKGDQDRAIADFSDAVRLNPKFAAAINSRGVSYGAKGDLDRAIADYSEAIRLDANYAIAYLNRSLIYYGRGDHDRAIMDSTEAIRVDPKFAEAFNTRGNAYTAKGDLDRAITDFNEAIRLDPHMAMGFNNRGIAYNEKGDPDRAIADYTEAIRLDPKYAAAFSNRGISYRVKRDLDRAIADGNEAIRLDPNFAYAFDYRGDTYKAKGDLDRAIADYTEAIRLARDFAVAFNDRGNAYYLRGDTDRAIADFTEALRLSPNLAGARKSLEQARTALAAANLRPSPRPAPSDVIAPNTSERRVALVIGNSEYRSVTVLPNPRRDARAVADALRQSGFQTVTLATDLTHEAMVKALRSFRAAADAADWALIYFAGHGLEINRINYLVPTDAKIEDERDVKAETVSYEDMLAAVGGARALRLVVLDACRVNPFKDRMRRIASASRTATDRGLAPPPDPEPGTLVVYSAKDGDVATDDVDGVNSPFARAFVGQLKVPGREVRRLFDYVRDEVLEATKKRQQPFTYGSLPGSRDYFFVSAR